jgi:hypothetical protein
MRFADSAKSTGGGASATPPKPAPCQTVETRLTGRRPRAARQANGARAQNQNAVNA